MEEQLNIAEIAGHSNEATTWLLLKEVSADLLEHRLCPIDPYRITIADEGHFSLTRNDTAAHEGFDAPEYAEGQPTEKEVVWSLGATAFFIVMGRQVINGKGGKGQQEHSRLPYLRSAWPELSELVQHCLRYDPMQRPSLQEVHDKAEQQYERCAIEIQHGPKLKESDSPATKECDSCDLELAFWPEAMQPKRIY